MKNCTILWKFCQGLLVDFIFEALYTYYSGSKEHRIIVKTGFELCDILMTEQEATV